MPFNAAVINNKYFSCRVTNIDGRCPNMISKSAFVSGIYKLTFDTGAYFRQNQTTGFYPYVEVSDIARRTHLHKRIYTYIPKKLAQLHI